MNPLDAQDVKHKYPVRLQMLVKAWQDKYKGPLEHSQRLQKLWMSGYYEKGYARYHLINLIDRAVEAGVAYLAEGNPKVLIEPLSLNLRPFAYAMRLIVNFLIEKNNFAENVFIPGAVASYFGAAIARTFTEYDRVVSVSGDTIKVGTPKVSIIEPCDYIGDPSAKVRDDFAFEGDMYRLPTEYAKDLFARKDKYGKQIADFIEADSKLTTRYSTEEITAKESYDFNKLALDEYSTFIDIYNRKDQTIETIMPMGHKAIIIKTIDSPINPYDYLGYKYPQNCPIPIPPAWNLYDLDVTMNIIGKSERERAEAQKTLIAAEPTGKAAADAVLKGKNMDVMAVKGMDSVKQFTFGGPTAEGMGWLAWAEAEAQKAGATSSDIFRGTGPTADTLGQDQMVYANAARAVNSYYTRFHNWMTSILRKWVNAVMENPSSYVEILDTVKVPGLGDYEYPVYFSKADKVADFSQLVLNVIPYSTQRMTPEMKYQRLMQLMTTWMIPTMQLRREQGADIDMQMVDKLLADYGGFDNFPQWYKSVIPTDEPKVDFLMKSDKKNGGQLNDQMGALDVSRMANSQGFDLREGMGIDRGQGATGMKGNIT